jgi:hypothetical protein
LNGRWLCMSSYIVFTYIHHRVIIIKPMRWQAMSLLQIQPISQTPSNCPIPNHNFRRPPHRAPCPTSLHLQHRYATNIEPSYTPGTSGAERHTRDPCAPLSALPTTGAAGNSDCGYRLRSHSFIKSEVAFFRLLGARRLSIGGRSSSSLWALGEELCPDSRDLDDLDFLENMLVTITRAGIEGLTEASRSHRASRESRG